MKERENQSYYSSTIIGKNSSADNDDDNVAARL